MSFRARREQIHRRRLLRKNQTPLEHGVGPYILDFFCPAFQIAIEIDGSQHQEPAQQAYDDERTHFLACHGIRVIRFSNAEINRDICAVLEDILKNCYLSPLRSKGEMSGSAGQRGSRSREGIP